MKGQFKRKFNDSVETLFRDIGEAQFLYNQNLWLIIQIGWWRDNAIQKPKNFGEKWKQFGVWSNPKNKWNTTKIQNMDPVPIINSVIKDDYVRELFMHTRLMRNLLTHFYHDEDILTEIGDKNYDGLMLFSCGECGPEEVCEQFVFTHNYYCRQLYNILCDFIDAEIEAESEPQRYMLSLRREGLCQGKKTLGIEHLHPRWDFDMSLKTKEQFKSNKTYLNIQVVREEEQQQILTEIQEMLKD